MDYTIAPRVMIPASLPRLYAHGHALDAMGRWTFRGVDVPPVGGVHRVDVDGITYETKHGGTCDRCGMAIQWIVTLSCDAGWCKVGVDCADYLSMPDASRVEYRRYMAEERAARRKAVRDEIRAERRAAADAATKQQIAKVVADHQTELANLAVLSSGGGFAASFAQSVIEQINHGRKMTDRQREILTKLANEMASRTPSRHLGSVGEKIKFHAQCVGAWVKPSPYGYGRQEYFFVFRTDTNDSVVWSTSASIAGLVKGRTANIVATVKAHGEYKGEAQTKILRAKVVLDPTREEIDAATIQPGQWRECGPDGYGGYAAVQIREAVDGGFIVRRYESDGSYGDHPYEAIRIAKLWPVRLHSAPDDLPIVSEGEVRTNIEGTITATVGAYANGQYSVRLVGENLDMTITMSAKLIVDTLPTVSASV